MLNSGQLETVLLMRQRASIIFFKINNSALQHIFNYLMNFHPGIDRCLTAQGIYYVCGVNRMKGDIGKEFEPLRRRISQGGGEWTGQHFWTAPHFCESVARKSIKFADAAG